MRTGTALVLAALAAATLPLEAHGNERGKAEVAISGKTVSIDYGRPSLNGRDMLGKAEVGKPWRLGADAATHFKSDADLVFGQTVVPKGEYTLTATKTGEAAWNLNFKPAKEGDKPTDVPLKVSQAAASVEELTISLKPEASGGHLEIAWGTSVMGTSFGVK